MIGVVATDGWVDVAGSEFVITFRYSKETVAIVKRAIPVRHYVPEAREWRAPLIPANIEAVARLARELGFEVSDEASDAFAGREVSLETLTYEGGDEMQVHLAKTPAVAKRIEPLFAMYDRAHHVWRVQLAPHSVEMLSRMVASFELTATDEARAELERRRPEVEAHFERYRRLGEYSIAKDAEFEVPGLQGEMYPFQRAGVRYALDVRRGFIADDQGLGKTIQAFATAHAADAYPYLVLTTKTGKSGWIDKLHAWLPGLKIRNLQGVKPPAVGLIAEPPADVYIATYDVIYAWVEYLKHYGIRGVICDESHYVKTWKSRRTRAVHELMESVPIDGLRLFTTGTPATKSPEDILTQLKLIDRIDDLGGEEYFRARYIKRDGTVKNGKELNARLRATCYIRRLKSEVLDELPPKQRDAVVLDVKLSPEYRAMLAETVDWLREHEGDPKTTDSVREKKLDALSGVIAVEKLDACVEWIREFLDGGESKLVVFALHIAVQQALVDAFPECVHILGSDSETARTDAERRFQNDPDVRLAILSLKAARESITLTAASDVAFVEMEWTSTAQDQAEDRCHRIGQEDSVTAWYLLAKDTPDVDKAELLDERRKQIAAMVDGRDVKEHESIVCEMTRRLLEGDE